MESAEIKDFVSEYPSEVIVNDKIKKENALNKQHSILISKEDMVHNNSLQNNSVSMSVFDKSSSVENPSLAPLYSEYPPAEQKLIQEVDIGV